ncbi:MAG: type II toxin-antitoxin system VapC family toxin [Paracoccus sp. (in: a-proteobacteria)]|uniref:type II toxin-antitoxin system VapC family toxin n=1 Tax=Paracoccus sp. TaxID=267 RepID=UPI0026E0C392|nr:type II toxin-antitoxin system VapC family toxin [Paracoccus sp. (in: a-proteobacteria)]MDO5623014.1 type II toxin-antitoxin system VapC family toxin [Paracoccus sp. (in: a-proteobacteria)]
MSGPAIAIDTSALMAVLLSEPAAPACTEALTRHQHLLISAGTMAEAQIVADRRGVGPEMAELIAGLGIETASVTALAAQQVAAAYAQWGKGIHPAGLNFGDCFAYALAKDRGLALLYVGDDFVRTDIASVLSRFPATSVDEVFGMLGPTKPTRSAEDMEKGARTETRRQHLTYR